MCHTCNSAHAGFLGCSRIIQLGAERAQAALALDQCTVYQAFHLQQAAVGRHLPSGEGGLQWEHGAPDKLLGHRHGLVPRRGQVHCLAEVRKAGAGDGRHPGVSGQPEQCHRVRMARFSRQRETPDHTMYPLGLDVVGTLNAITSITVLLLCCARYSCEL